MVGIRFHDRATELKAFGLLIGRVSFKSFSDGLTIVPPDALTILASHRLKFDVEGPAGYERSILTLRNPSSPSTQRRKTRRARATRANV
jgi:hypothetical protein